MATPMLLMAAQKSNANASQETKPEPTKTRPSRSSKSAPRAPAHKKPPQRGLGVAQLERLRLQERWKKMTEMPPPPVHAHHFANIPGLHFSAVDDCTGEGGGLVFQGMGNVGGFVAGAGGFTVVEPYTHGGGALDPRVLIGSYGEEDLRELSSIPKMPMPCVSDRCDICFKKKRVNISTELPAAAAIINTDSYDFLGLSTNSAARGGGGTNQGGAEIKQIHRKLVGNGGGGGENILMEYEFFPGKNGRGTEFKELEMPKEEEEEEEEFSFAEEAVDHGEASSCITTTYNTAIVNNNGSSSSGSSAVDLSLKLSF